ncbi:MAG: peptide chain release factor N(5)-glutamine methyltransferase [Propionibacteriaceae bacterium]|nr:peptide chain release factor N(5)-glutamine methyltransferase [Propionibacteriaceae bacterium]
MTSASQAIIGATAQLKKAGIASPKAEARSLVCFALNLEPTQLLLAETLSPTDIHRLDEMIAERIGGTPLQYVTGEAFFRKTSVRVGPGVFIPRPETEVLAGWAIDQVRLGYTRVVELCAGTGAISLAIAQESHPSIQWAVESSETAYSYLLENLIGTSIIPVQADMATALPELDGTVDLVVVNPPYLPESSAKDLPSDVLAEPAAALFSGEDGMDAMKTVLRTARRLLRPKGELGVEHGDDQELKVQRLFARARFEEITSWPDLSSRPRFITARKPDVQ